MGTKRERFVPPTPSACRRGSLACLVAEEDNGQRICEGGRTAARIPRDLWRAIIGFELPTRACGRHVQTGGLSQRATRRRAGERSTAECAHAMNPGRASARVGVLTASTRQLDIELAQRRQFA
jgi:hypothetical protein